MTTLSHENKIKAFLENHKIGPAAPIEPQKLYLGAKEDTKNYNCRAVRQLNDLEILSDDEVKPKRGAQTTKHATLKQRDWATVHSQTNLIKYLTTETKKLTLTQNMNLSADCISKLSLLAPNLEQLSIKRLTKTLNRTFADAFEHWNSLKYIDIIRADGLYPNALQLLLGKNPALEKILLPGCSNAVNDHIMELISKKAKLTHLDISYCNHVTDKGLNCFSGKTIPLESLNLNGLRQVSSQGIATLVATCTKTLESFEASNQDQADFNSDGVFQWLGQCINLEVLDLTGCLHLNDQAFANVAKQNTPVHA